MIQKLKRRFVGIAAGAVAVVLLLLCILVNLGNRFYLEKEASSLLELICENEGTIPRDIGGNTREDPGAGKQPSQNEQTPPGKFSAGEELTKTEKDYGQEDPAKPEKTSGQKEQTPPEKLSDPGNSPDPGDSSDAGDTSSPGKPPSQEKQPASETKPAQRKSSRYTEETPYATRYFTVRYDENGTVLKSDLDNIAAVTEDELDGFVAVAHRTGEGYGHTGNYRYLVQKIGSDKYMAVFLDCHEKLRDADNLIWISAVLAVVCTGLVWLAVSLLSGKAMRPYEKNLTMQKQFITDAGHELKTPLTVLGTNLSVLEMEVGKQKWIDASRDQVRKMTELVNALVSISRMDEENPPVTRTNFDLSSAVTETAELFRLPLEEAGHPLLLHIEEHITYCGDAALLCRLVSILLDNAMKYAAGEGEVRLELAKKGGQNRLVCMNPCEELSREELDHLFDRFYRGDKSRSTRGFGIGLSYAKSIVEAHGGRLTAAMKDGQIVFTAVLR